ncbi:MAG: hypothetical protein RJA25_1120 [Bacteroidota bacterium]|jgi:rhodanese-related sulfurtransferase
MSYQELNPKEFLAAFNEQKEEAVLLDVRTPAEIAEINIDGHIAIDIQQAPIFMQKVAELDKNKTYFIYCRSGNRSGQACKFMASQGFQHLYNLKGGMLAWMQTDFE